MPAKVLRKLLILILSLGLATQTPPAKAETLHAVGVEVVVGIVVISAAAAVTIIYLATRHPSIKGCVVNTPDGLAIAAHDNQPTYKLMGDTAAFKPGDFVKVKGKKRSVKGRPDEHSFVVTSVAKDYGSCPAHP